MEGSVKVIPDSVMEAVKKTSSNLNQISGSLDEFLALCKPEVLAKMDPLDRAQTQLLVAQLTTNLFALKLRCNGVNPDDHPIKKEFERLNMYQEKVDRAKELSKAPLRPSVTINSQAATRFIEHSLPDLTREQKQSLREISVKEKASFRYTEGNMNRKRKYHSADKKSVQAAAKEFLEKASRELLGDDTDRLKGPMKYEDTDDEIDALFGDSEGKSSDPIVIDDSDQDDQAAG